MIQSPHTTFRAWREEGRRTKKDFTVYIIIIIDLYTTPLISQIDWASTSPSMLDRPPPQPPLVLSPDLLDTFQAQTGHWHTHTLSPFIRPDHILNQYMGLHDLHVQTGIGKV